MSPFGSSPFLADEARACRSCMSHRQMEFLGEICMHFPRRLESLNKPLVWVFPEVVVCLDCGLAQFSIPEPELRTLANGVAA